MKDVKQTSSGSAKKLTEAALKRLMKKTGITHVEFEADGKVYAVGPHHVPLEDVWDTSLLLDLSELISKRQPLTGYEKRSRAAVRAPRKAKRKVKR